MNRPGRGEEKELPAWVLPAAAVLAAAVLGGIAWWAWSGPSIPAGRDIAVRPGMYDLRQEMQKAGSRSR